jgi:hypothetical protein
MVRRSMPFAGTCRRCSGPPTPSKPGARAQQFENLSQAYDITANITSLFALFIGMFIIFNTFSIAVTQRRSEIGILRALGAFGGQIRRLFLLESAVLGLIGTAVASASADGKWEVVYRPGQILFASNVAFSGLNGRMSQQELDLLQFATRGVAQASASFPEVVGRQRPDSGTRGAVFHDVPKRHAG